MQILISWIKHEKEQNSVFNLPIIYWLNSFLHGWPIVFFLWDPEKEILDCLIDESSKWYNIHVIVYVCVNSNLMLFSRKIHVRIFAWKLHECEFHVRHICLSIPKPDHFLIPWFLLHHDRDPVWPDCIYWHHVHCSISPSSHWYIKVAPSTVWLFSFSARYALVMLVWVILAVPRGD